MLRKLFIIWLMALAPAGAAHARDINIITTNTTITPLWQFVSSAPADNALLNAAPQSVSITFSQNIDPGKSTLSVYDPYNNPLGDISAQVSGASMTTKLPRLLTGTYRVEWQADCLCKDSSPLHGVLHFTVQ